MTKAKSSRRNSNAETRNKKSIEKREEKATWKRQIN